MVESVKIVRNNQNYEKYKIMPQAKSPKMFKIAKNGQNGLKSTKMVPNGPKW